MFVLLRFVCYGVSIMFCISLVFVLFRNGIFVLLGIYNVVLGLELFIKIKILCNGGKIFVF